MPVSARQDGTDCSAISLVPVDSSAKTADRCASAAEEVVVIQLVGAVGEGVRQVNWIASSPVQTTPGVNRVQRFVVVSHIMMAVIRSLANVFAGSVSPDRSVRNSVLHIDLAVTVLTNATVLRTV